MTRLSLALLLSTSMLVPAFADELTFASTVDAVTVFPRGAEVERIAKGTLKAGSHTVLVENLPANVSPDSVRVSGLSDADISISSVDVKQVYLSRNFNSEDRLKLERQIEVLNDEMRRLNQVISDTKLQRDMLQNLITNAGKPAKGQAGNALSALEVAQLLDGAAMRLDQYGQRTIDAQASQRDIQRQIQELNHQIALLAPVEELRSVVSINLDAAAATDASFNVKYAIAEAGWRAIYDAKLTLGGDASSQTMDVMRRALVQQGTSESWNNVALTLSTARPSSRTFAPELLPYEINQIEEMPYRARKLESLQYRDEEEDRSNMGASLQTEAPAEPTPVQEVRNQQVVMDVGGFQATYEIPARVTVSNSGETKSVVMGKDQFNVDLSAYAVPRLDPAAYLIANFKLAGEVTYLPGPVLLSRDDAYIGRGHMPMLAPGDEHDLSFGQDDFVLVERVETDKKEGESGLISASLTDQRSASTTIKNLHTFPMHMKIVDRLPVSNHEDIKVRMLPGSTMPTNTDVDDQRGIVEWVFELAEGEETKIDFGYTVSWPKAMEISMVD